MSDVGAKVVGADRVERTMRRLSKDLGDLGPAHARIGARAVATARSLIPSSSGRSTGRLSSSVRADAKNNRVRITASAPYAHPIESGVGPRPGLRGGHNIRPARFMRAAAREAATGGVDLVAADVVAATNKVKGA